MEPPLSGWKRFLDDAYAPGLRALIVPSMPAQSDAGEETPQPCLRRVSDDDRARRLNANHALVAAANPHLEWISALLADVPHVVYLVDADGVVLRSAGRCIDLERFGPLAGTDWSGSAVASSGAGTALTADQPVAVVEPESLEQALGHCVCTAAPVHAPSGRVTAAIAIITPADHASPERLPLAAHTAFSVEQALRTSARVEQAESVRLLALLARFTAHELVSPIAALKTMLDLLARTRLADESSRLLATVRRHADHLLQVVEELRILGGSHDRRLQRIDPLHVVQSAVASAGLGRRVQLDVRLADGEAIACNPPLLCRALDNLLRNAHDAVGEKGEVGVQLQKSGDKIHIAVWDNGPGIPLEQQARLFQESFTTKPSGSGLGLLLAKAVVEHVHEGRLRYRSNSPRGARFEMELPAASR